MRVPNPFIDTPPEVKNLGDRFEITAVSGKVTLPAVLSRHAAVGFFMALQKALAEDAGISPQELCLRIAENDH